MTTRQVLLITHCECTKLIEQKSEPDGVYLSVIEIKYTELVKSKKQDAHGTSYDSVTFIRQFRQQHADTSRPAVFRETFDLDHKGQYISKYWGK